MEQRDYLLKEIEKIGLLLRMILNKLTRREENYAITIEGQLQESKELLIKEIGFDLDKLIAFNNQEIKQYISQFNGFNGTNIEHLADILKEMGINKKLSESKGYLEKALALYELCNSLDKTFSFDRESKIAELNQVLSTLRESR